MAEINREPIFCYNPNDGDDPIEYVMFDEYHTFNDFVRYLKSQGMTKDDWID